MAKLYIALKESNETLYWLRLLKKVRDIDEQQFSSIHSDCEELKRLLVTIIKTKRKNIDESKS